VLFTTAEMKNINISEMVRYIFVFLVIKLKAWVLIRIRIIIIPKKKYLEY